ncbi:MAG: DMT family transporter [Culturomica sp.]|jgi:drug/metabolite transporter (DMT)-like permease|nr:DMT family transporter [Culturomica sp.]
MKITGEKCYGHAVILCTNLIFGMNIPIAKSVLSEEVLSPFALTLLRMAVATLFFWGIGLFTKSEKVPAKDLLLMLFASFFGLAGAQISFAFALQNSSPVSLSLISSLTPVVVMLLAALFLKEPVSWKKTIGVLFGVAGASLIIVNSLHTIVVGENRMLGNLLGVVNIVSYAIYLVMIRPIAQRYSAVTVMKWMFLFSVPLSMPWGMGDLLSAKLFTSETTVTELLSVTYIVVFATTIAYFLIPIGLKRMRPTTVSMYSNIQPIVASTVAIVVGQDVFSWDKPLAAVLVLYGVYLVTQSRARTDTNIK